MTLEDGTPRRKAGTGTMQPGTIQPRAVDEAHARRAAPSGVAHRPEGQALALERADRYRGFTNAVPSVTAACETLLATARDAGLSPAVLRTLTVVLRALPAHRWRDGKPVLWLSNQRIADLVGCSSRTVQRHLRILHELGIIAIGWGPGNARLPYRQDSDDAAELVGIDLRPALVFATEMAIRRQTRLAALRACDTACHAANTAILVARGPVPKVRSDGFAAVYRKQLAELRQQVLAANRQAHRTGTATVATIGNRHRDRDSTPCRGRGATPGPREVRSAK